MRGIQEQHTTWVLSWQKIDVAVGLNYVPYRIRHQTPPPPAPEPGGAPQKLCGHCGNTGEWLEREPGQFQCNVCGRTP